MLASCAVLATPPTSPTSETVAAGCRSFGESTVEAASWSGTGQFLGVVTSGEDGLMQALVFSWPGMVLVNEARTGMLSGEHVPVADDGSIFWSVSDPFSSEPDATTLWQKAIDRDPQRIGLLPDGRYLEFFWAAGALVATERDQGPPEQWRLARLPATRGDREAVALVPWNPWASHYWIDPSGQWITWTEPDGSGQRQEVVVRNGDREWRHVLPGYGGRSPTLTPARDAVVYQRSETSRLTLLDLESGQVVGDLDSGEYYGGEVSASGILAAPTARYGEPNELCLVDVRAKLGAS